MKTCCDCHLTKEFERFSKNKLTSDGYQKICKECSKKRKDKYRNGIDNKIHEKSCESCAKKFKTEKLYQRFCSMDCVRSYFNSKDENVLGYCGIHYWLYKNFGKPKECAHCGKIGKKYEKSNIWNIDWANKSAMYKKDINDWFGLCKSCHKKYDKGIVHKKYILHPVRKRYVLNNSHFGILGGNYKSPCSNSCATQQ